MVDAVLLPLEVASIHLRHQFAVRWNPEKREASVLGDSARGAFVHPEATHMKVA